MAERARDLDCVRLLQDVNGWPAGTEAVVVAEGSGMALVEVATEDMVDREGLPLRDLFDDLIHVDYEDLEIVAAYAGRQPPAGR